MKKLLLGLVFFGMVSSADAVSRLNVKVNAPANEESNLSWENDAMSIQAIVAPYDEERVQIDMTVSEKIDEKSVVLLKPRIITYMGEEASFVVKGKNDQSFEMTVFPESAKERSLEVEVVEENAQEAEEVEQNA